jgi:RNA polymerase sigma-70 factor (ECF subfamily)
MNTVALEIRIPMMASAAGAEARRPELGGAERSLVDAARTGDREAFDRLVELHQRNIYGLCLRYAGNHPDASDLAQETFVKAYRSIRSFRGDSSFSTWLYRIGVNTCLSYRSGRRPAAEELKDEHVTEKEDALFGLQQAEEARMVRAAIRALPERQRLTLILKLYHDRTHEEIAKVMGTSVGTAKANLFHALANLRKSLEPKLKKRTP